MSAPVEEKTVSPLDSGSDGDSLETKKLNQDYSVSDMGEIHMEYLRHSSDQTSVSHWVTMYALKKTFDKRELMDRARSKTLSFPRFALVPNLLEEIVLTINQMQSVLGRSAALVRGHDGVFLIGPKSSLFPILEGAASLEELNVAWLALRKCFGLADKFLTKYQQEFRTQLSPGPTMPNSPVSTNSGVYERMPQDALGKEHLDFLYSNGVLGGGGEKGRRGDRFRMGYDQARECRRSMEVNGRGFRNTDIDHYTTARFKGMKEEGKEDGRGLPGVNTGKPEEKCRRPEEVRPDVRDKVFDKSGRRTEDGSQVRRPEYSDVGGSVKTTEDD
ncbi:hypothetical protein K438DRAFT_1751505 [Mycena galopus ATCC 62051]|nr:hypothetical protein K438DRAFT_1751505 [Mycena galopus ATCC 62051]